MSHISRVTLKVRDLDALAEAAEHCDMTLVRGAQTHKWFGRFMGDTAVPMGMDPEDYGKCEHKLALKHPQHGDYEIGLVPAYDGDGYDLAIDTWNQTRLLDAVGGASMPKLKREYAAAVAVANAKKKLGHKGFTVTRTNIGNRIQIALVRR